jgi:hypothetical protein
MHIGISSSQLVLLLLLLSRGLSPSSVPVTCAAFHHRTLAVQARPWISRRRQDVRSITGGELTVAGRSPHPLLNAYDDWRADAVVGRMHLDEDNVRQCLDEFVQSRYGQEMFGCHDRAASVGITGSIKFVELCGPEVTLELKGAFWHRRETVLGRAATWLNARMPEITDVVVADIDDLSDFEEIRDEVSGEVLFRRDKRAQDFNGDRETMEYQGIDPDMRGPFPQGPLNSSGGASMINPI